MLLEAKQYIKPIVIILLLFNCGKLLADENLAGLKYILNCSECHGFDGNSNNSEWPNIAGLNEKYIVKQLLDFKSGNRENKDMSEIIQYFPSDKELNELATYFAKQKAINTNSKKAILSNPIVDLKLGEEIYKGKRIDYGIPGCGTCHGINAMGDKDGKYPRLHSQHKSYLVQQMKQFRSKKRSNDNPAMMRNIAMMMDDEDIESVTAYIALMSIQ